APRCPRVTERCREAQPPLAVVASEHTAACWYAHEEMSR
ncbi:MAG: ABC transporter ATP-binding protein, partial [Chloroflexales bacterium]|nr:ABC transporter ATP-binding protein [Chloroflexales bacterium]